MKEAFGNLGPSTGSASLSTRNRHRTSRGGDDFDEIIGLEKNLDSLRVDHYRLFLTQASKRGPKVHHHFHHHHTCEHYGKRLPPRAGSAQSDSGVERLRSEIRRKNAMVCFMNEEMQDRVNLSCCIS